MAKILIVDDSMSICEIVQHTLRDAGHDCATALNGKLALDECTKQQFDVVITDINMPVMNGFELTKALRALPDYVSVPILVLTSEAGAADKARGKDAGATGWMVKPFDAALLLRATKAVLKQKR